MWIHKDVLCTSIIAPLLPCDLAGTLCITRAIPSIRWLPLRGYSYRHHSNTCRQVVPHSHVHLMPYVGQEDHRVSPSPSPASRSPPTTPSWLALPMNWQLHFCLSSPACWHTGYCRRLGSWTERGIAAPCAGRYSHPLTLAVVTQAMLGSLSPDIRSNMLWKPSCFYVMQPGIYITYSRKKGQDNFLPAFQPLAVLRMPFQQPPDQVNSPCPVLLLWI